MKFKIPTANFQTGMRGEGLSRVFPRPERWFLGQRGEKNPIGILKIQLKFRYAE